MSKSCSFLWDTDCPRLYRGRDNVVGEAKGDSCRNEVPHGESPGAAAAEDPGEALFENIENALKHGQT
jgi:hypothetical protein